MSLPVPWTVGLDPKQIIEIRDLVKSLGKDHTVILSSHILTEISAVCDYVLIINKGRLVAADATENLSKMFARQNSLELLLDVSQEEAEKVLDKLRKMGYGRLYKTNNSGKKFIFYSD